MNYFQDECVNIQDKYIELRNDIGDRRTKLSLGSPFHWGAPHLFWSHYWFHYNFELPNMMEHYYTMALWKASDFISSQLHHAFCNLSFADCKHLQIGVYWSWSEWNKQDALVLATRLSSPWIIILSFIIILMIPDTIFCSNKNLHTNITQV